MTALRTVTHRVDFCVVGGGLAGLCAAIAAARQGLQVALVQDRPVLGGNASSEIRMWICGAHGQNNRETGIVEELELENNFRNPSSNFSIWDSVLYQAAWAEPGLQLCMNASVNGAVMEGSRICSVKAWQTTTQTWHVFEADLFADCSGDSILAPLTGAEFRVGREARSEFDEDIQPEQGDRKTMGMSCLIQARETDSPKTYTPPSWARRFSSEADLPHRIQTFTGLGNFWWMELGGEDDSIHDTEVLRDKLVAVAFGVWDHIKNHGDHGAANWELEWVGFLPGKRESRRYVGDLLMNQNDVRSEGRFHDIIAYGGWSMDDHHPAGLNYPGVPTIFHPAPSPYGISYRCLYSRNIDNLLFAGRNISVTHAALSSSRVMATCATLGQAAGTAAAVAHRHECSPRQVGQEHILELQLLLMDDDCYLPWQKRMVSPLSQRAVLTASAGDPAPLRNGIDRPLGEVANSWGGAPGSWVQYDLGECRLLKRVRIVFDSDLNRHGKGACAKHAEKNILSNFPLHQPARTPPAALVKAFRLECSVDGQQWECLACAADSHQRLVKIPLSVSARHVRLVLEAAWGGGECRLFAFEVE